MFRKCLFAVAAILIVIAAWVHWPVRQPTPEPQQLTKVAADDLDSGRVVVIGSLGIPIETMAAVRGVWKYPGGASKDRHMSFHVTHVNGKPVDKPIKFHRRLMHVSYPLPWKAGDERDNGPTPSSEETWEIRAYETGRFATRPDDYNRELGTHLNAEVGHPVWSRHFLLELHGIMARPDAGRGN